MQKTKTIFRAFNGLALKRRYAHVLTAAAVALPMLAPLTAHAADTGNVVTIYGVLDSTLEYVSDRGASYAGSQSRVESNSSLIGFKGREDLGSGSAAIWQVESGINVASGTGGSFATRDTFVGWSDPTIGEFKLGYLTTPLRGMGGKLNFVPGSTSIANNIGIMTTLNGVQTGLNSRLANAVQYTSPSVKGVTLAVAGSPKTPGGSGSDLNYDVFGGGLSYEGNGWYLGYSYESRRDRSVTLPSAQTLVASGDSNDYEHRIAIRYTFPTQTSVGVGWDRLGSSGQFGSGAAAGGGRVQRDAYSASVMQAVGKQEFIAHYAVARDLQCEGHAVSAASGTYAGCAASGQTGAQQVSLVYHYWLSKQTMLEGYYSQIWNKAHATYDFDTNPYQSNPLNRVAGTNPAGIGLGLRVSF